MKNISLKRRYTLVMLLIASALAFVLAFVTGSSGVSVKELFGLISGARQEKALYDIFMNLRLPRALFAYLAGGALSVAGACLQGLFRNPMADSYILGVSSGAGLGATLAIVLGVGTVAQAGNLSIAVFAFAGAMMAVLSVYALSKYNGRLSTVSLILSGMAVSAFSSAIVYFLMILNRDKMEHVVMWTLGSFQAVSWDKLIVVAPAVILSSVACLLFRRDLNIMLLGDEEARHLGVDTQKVRSVLLVLTTLMSSSVVSFCGIIGFVGLMCPHMLRLLIGPDHKYLLPYSFLGGAVFLLLADTVARILLPMQEIPVGVITAVLGAPFFVYLMRRGQRGGAL